MSTPAIAYVARNYVLERLEDTVSGFNYLINQTALTYEVQPFQLSHSGTLPSLFLGRYVAANIQKAQGGGSSINYPIVVLSTAKVDNSGKQALRVTPSTFSGQVIISIDFNIAYPFSNTPPDGDAMFFAVTDALAGAMNSQQSYASVPMGLGYNNEFMAEADVLNWDGTRWIQFIPCALFFNVIA